EPQRHPTRWYYWAVAVQARRTMKALHTELVGCRRCPRLVAWREQVARERRASFANERYWGRPVPGFGDPGARILLLGLAPAAHGRGERQPAGAGAATTTAFHARSRAPWGALRARRLLPPESAEHLHGQADAPDARRGARAGAGAGRSAPISPTPSAARRGRS